ncbi:hypothetical protein [Wolbachia endosymbiont of Litomosoides sigmodontis]|uniref:hypothetical protein n=1 Tax=Wolbachia endosymbiont of Litomosoides sigmodontis TaxID=80850 RepID=UPI001FE587BC|nr:hypothetical protein [Wolbachia endosymbiont of Litomosoides sigmodontis]
MAGQLLKEQSEKSIIKILNLSAGEVLRSFCVQCNSPVQESNFPKCEEPSTSHEEDAAEGSETTIIRDLF